MRRRELMAMIGGAAAIWPLAARAQGTGKVYRIGILEAVAATENTSNLAALRKGLRDLGYVEGQNLTIEYRSADGRAERYAGFASELVRLKVDLIVTRGTPAAQAAKNATRTIPVVMATTGVPLSIVASFAHPGGNVTGLTTFTTVLTEKRIEILKELIPTLSRVALLQDIGNPMAAPQWNETTSAARSLGLEAELLAVEGEADLRRAFDVAARHHVGALLVGGSDLIEAQRGTIIDSAERTKLPASYQSRDFVEAGGLIAYGVRIADLYFRAASFVDKIFKGAKPADLPVEQPTRFELVINLKTAKALGLAIAPSILARADEVIE